MTFKTALVTGGGHGIGTAISKQLAARGANIIVNYLSNKESAERVVSEIKARKDAAGPVGSNSTSNSLPHNKYRTLSVRYYTACYTSKYELFQPCPAFCSNDYQVYIISFGVGY
jgi:NAD(P)-dependent dehydrogenase (short-subunit alcohol dehydrogenase family)